MYIPFPLHIKADNIFQSLYFDILIKNFQHFHIGKSNSQFLILVLLKTIDSI